MIELPAVRPFLTERSSNVEHKPRLPVVRTGLNVRIKNVTIRNI